jgi:hypothetical protein
MATMQDVNADQLQGLVLFRLQKRMENWRLLSDEHDEFVNAYRRLEAARGPKVLEVIAEIERQWPNLT